ncbi:MULTISPECIES: hypothetical protein [Sulfurimonas]|uniref:Cardiolipin synthase N-terminal domain-containing protein n=1 Tax=Sulfurimonas diazotrophicus TaxID=3131939 RepID=A0ABZ3HC75_9BACT
MNAIELLGNNMTGVYLFLIWTVIAVDIGAIMSILLEEMLYTRRTKIFKTIVILGVPLIGAVFEIWLLRKYKENDTATDNRTDDLFYTAMDI